MAGPFKFSLGFDAAEFIKGSGRVSDQLEEIRQGLEEIGDAGDAGARQAADALKEIDDVADRIDLEKIGDEAKDTGNEVAAGLDKGTEDAEKAFEDLRKATVRVLDDVADRARTTGRDVGDDVAKGTRAAGDGFDELKDEAKQSARESAASFSGEFDDVADLIQEIAANAFAGFGPLGAAAGIAAAAGLGAITKAIQGAKDKAEEAQERFANMVETLTSGDPDAVFEMLNENIKDIIVSNEDAIVSFEEFNEIMDDLNGTGIRQEEVLLALAGDSGAIARVQKALDPLIEKEQQARAMHVMSTEAYEGSAASMEKLRNKLDEVTGSTEGTISAADTYTKASEYAREAVDQTAKSQAELNAELQEEAKLREELAESNRNYAEILAEQDDNFAEATAAVKENNEAIADGAQLKIENTAVLADFADSLIDEAEAAEKAGIKGDELNGVLASNYDEFRRVGEAAGLTSSEVDELARRFGLLPAKEATAIETPGMPTALEKSRTLDERIRRIPSTKSVAVGFTSESLQTYVDRKAKGVSVTIPLRYRQAESFTKRFAVWW